MIPLFERAANLEHAKAQAWLADVYRSSQKKHANMKKHVAWMEKAAESGNKDAQFSLAELYLKGDGVTRDEKKAFMWLEKSARNGHTKAQAQLGNILLNGLIGQKADSKMGRSWLAHAAKNGSPEAHAMLGMMYLTGESVEKNVETARALLIEAARLGDKDVIFIIANSYVNGEFGKHDVVNALTWLHIAELTDDPRANHAKKLFMQNYAYSAADMQKATIRAKNCMTTNLKRCEYDKKVLRNYSQEIYEDVLKGLKEKQ